MSGLPEKRNLGVLARRLVLFDRARVAVGAAALSAALGISDRAIRYKVSVESVLSDADMRGAIDAVEQRRVELAKLADDMRAMLA